MQPKELVLSARVVAGQSPFIQTSRIWRGRERLEIGIRSVDCHGAESGETSRMAYMDTVQRYRYQYSQRQISCTSHTSIECILIGCPGVVGDLNPGLLLGRIVIDVEIRALVESMVNGLASRLCEIGMDVCEADTNPSLSITCANSSCLFSYSHGQHPLFTR